MNIRYCDIDKKKVSYYDEGSSESIVFLHGWGQNKDSFLQTFNYLKDDYRVISVDLLGHGDSDEPNDTLNLDEYIDTLSKLFSELNIANPIIIAHSFGARIALKMAADKKLTNKFILTGAAGIKPKRKFSYYAKVWNYKIMKFLVKTPFYHQYEDDLYQTSGSSDYRNASDVMKQVLINTVNEDLSSRIKEVENKTFLFWGANDEATPLNDGKFLNTNIKNSEFVVVDGTHYAFLEHINKFNEKVKNFLEEK